MNKIKANQASKQTNRQKQQMDKNGTYSTVQKFGGLVIFFLRN